MTQPGPELFEQYRDFFLNQNITSRINSQRKARALLFEDHSVASGKASRFRKYMEALAAELSEGAEIFLPNAVQKMVYENDTGTHIIPGFVKDLLLNVRLSFVLRPGCVEDVQAFVRYAAQNKLSYTVRGAGTWPFGGCVPLDDDIVLDLSGLDFKRLDEDNDTLLFGAGLLFPKARDFLKQAGYTLCQEITNPHSGTIAGWIVTGGLGLGSYKYGPVRDSVEMLLVVKPDGQLLTLLPRDGEFDALFNSEGQLGIVVGGALKVRRESFVSKPYAFSFERSEDVASYIERLRQRRIRPTSVIYFDRAYIAETARIERKHNENDARQALEINDQKRLNELQDDKRTIRELEGCAHILVLHFDAQEDFEAALKTRLFAGAGENIRVEQLLFRQLSTELSHKLWEHRFLPVQMKQSGPSMLVSETILPLESFVGYQNMTRQLLQRLLGIDLKSEGHLLQEGRMLIQSIVLADTRTLRHKIYFGLVPLMTQAAQFFGAIPYGIGLWNYPFFKRWKRVTGNLVRDLLRLKRSWDPGLLLNRGKYFHPRGRRLAFRLFSSLTPALNGWFVRTTHKRQQGKKNLISYPLQRLAWNVSSFFVPRVVPSDLKKQRTETLESVISPCAECDSCERVCPTSDVFGMYGPATPITRRKTAQRLVEGESISREEALGFLACTRCDNCVRVCPTDIPLTRLFDMVEEDNRFVRALGLEQKEKAEYIERFWQIMKESPLYTEHTHSEQKDNRSHLQHGLNIVYPRGFEYGQLYIDPKTCIHCGMCSDENACMYGARHGKPREIPELLDLNCALCNACVNYCPQNKVAQEERSYIDNFIYNATDLEEKRYWVNRQSRIHDTTTVHRSTKLTDMADKYVTEDIIMEIDKEASTGQIPVSGMGQGDRHMGIGFDAERFAHFHIVGPAQNRLHEGDPEEELSVILGKRDSYCRFDKQENLIPNDHRTIKLMTPILYNALRLESNGRAELALIKVAEKQKSLVVVPLERILQNYNTFLREGDYDKLPAVLVPRADHELIDRLQVNPRTNRELLTDLWRMPMFEVEYHKDIGRTISYIRDSVKSSGQTLPLIAGYVEVSEYDLIGSLSPTVKIKEMVNHFLDQNIDVLHIHGKRNKDEYFVTSSAVRAIHHYLMRIGRRHEVSLIASGGIRLASDSQKTIQRGAEATLIDFAALLALDPSTYRAIKEDKATTEKLLSLDLEKAVKRLNNQAESRKVQILEVLGASGFKDIKKTVGEEGRLIDFHALENRLQRNVFEKESWIDTYAAVNAAQLANENIPEKSIRRYSQLKKQIVPLEIPHNFYLLGQTNQTLYKRDYVWPGMLIESMGRMGAGDLSMLDLNKVKQTGLLGDGFDVMKILYNKDPMDVEESELDEVQCALPLDKDLVLEAPWMFGGKSVGSIGLDSWRAHVVAARELGIQYDTGEGGYPTRMFLDSKGQPVFFNEEEIELIAPLFEDGESCSVDEIRRRLKENGISEQKHPQLFEKIASYPALKPVTFMVVIDKEDEPFVSTELKTGLFGVSKQTIRKARRVVIAYSQGAKMGIGGHILAQKVNKLVSYLRGVEGLEQLDNSQLEKLIKRLIHISKQKEHALKKAAEAHIRKLDALQQEGAVSDELKETLLAIQDEVYRLYGEKSIDEIDFENIIQACESVVKHSYSSIISPFPFHNCYSIEDVKAFIDVVHMINPGAVISVKVSPSIDIEFIAAGLARIARDNTDEIVRAKFGTTKDHERSQEIREYAKKHGMKIEVWLDGPRGGTGASPNIIKGQMGMHLEYAIPLIHNRLVRDGLRNNVKFVVSGGIRTYEDVVKAVALGADGVIWGTASLVSVGCDRNRNCHDGCSRGIATSNLTMQKLRDVDSNTRQMINAFIMMQMQVMRALAALGMKDIRELRGRFDKIHWIGLKERVDHRFRINKEIQKAIMKDEELFLQRLEHETGQSNCGVAAVNGTEPIPGYILDKALEAMRNRGMDGVGIAKTLCFPEYPDAYAYSIMVKGVQQREIENNLRLQWQTSGQDFSEDDLRKEARKMTLFMRSRLMERIKKVFLDPYFDYVGETRVEMARDAYKRDEQGNEMDYREFGNPDTDPGDIFRFFVRAKKEAVHNYIEKTLLKYDWSKFLEHQFPDVTKENYEKSEEFIQKAEDLYVFDHSLNLTRVLYVSEAADTSLMGDDGHPAHHDGNVSEEELTNLRRFINTYPYERNRQLYKDRSYKIAAVMSCGKNFATWKTAGRVIPWQTPDAPNNIIHVRLATGSVVEQMNSHPFAKLHTALTHNGETTNFEALKQRVEQFNLYPLASTDTEVAALKFHLIADEWGYPDWAIFESLSPTTGDDLELVDEKLRAQLEAVQRVEFASSPDGPYQYLCLRHDPYRKVSERVDIKDPADLRPNVTAFWHDQNNGKKRAFTMIASEEQAVQRMLHLMDKEGLIDGAMADHTTVSPGMISRYRFDEKSKIHDYEFCDRYGNRMQLDEAGLHYSVRRARILNKPQEDFSGWEDNHRSFMTKNLAALSFNDLHWLLHQLVDGTENARLFMRNLEILTWLRDYLCTLDPGEKAISSLQDMAQYYINRLLQRAAKHDYRGYRYFSMEQGVTFNEKPAKDETLIVNARGFLPEGSDPDFVLASFLNRAYELGWRRFILFKLHGQRLISTAVMGRGNTDDVEMDVYGSVGEYFGAFMQGGTIRLHGNAQNFTAMCMHHGNLYIFGNAGKVCGYASKGGKVFIMGNVVDRCWTNSVNDSRCQPLEVTILGSATKYAGESLMGGQFIFSGLHFNKKGRLNFNERPYLGTKMLGGASRGRFLFFDPEERLLEAQYTHGKVEAIDDETWDYFRPRLREMFDLSNIPLYKKNGSEYLNVQGKMIEFNSDAFKLIVPKGGLKGYESH